MSMWSTLIAWALKAAKSEAQTVGLQAIQQTASDFAKALETHAPDMAASLQPLVQQVVTGAVAGVMTKSASAAK